MGRNHTGGKKHKKYKNKNNNENLSSKQIIFAERDYGQEYFIITKMLGDGRCSGNGADGREDVLLIIRGSMRKKVWIHTGDMVLASYRDFQTGKPIADIIHKYTPADTTLLQNKYNVSFGKKENKDSIYESEDEDAFRFEDL